MVGFDLYIAYLNDELSAEKREEVTDMLASSDVVPAELEAARAFLAAQTLELPRPSVIDAIKDRFRRNQERLKQVVQKSAELRFDSWENAAALGMRGRPQERSMLFSSGMVDLDIQLAQDADATTQTLHGQVLTDDDDLSGIELQLQARDVPDSLPRRVVTDQLGRFRFSHLETGHYDLQVLLADSDVEVNLEA